MTPLMTVAEAADRLRVSTDTVRVLAASGQLDMVRIRRTVRITAESVDRFITVQIDKAKSLHPSRAGLTLVGRAPRGVRAYPDTLRAIGDAAS